VPIRSASLSERCGLFSFGDGRQQTAAEDCALNLTGEELERCKEMRRKVEAEIAAGTRTALFAPDLLIDNT
jgi:hypothetical protein